MDIKFKPLKFQDIVLIEKWYNEPHVRKFYDSGILWSEARKKYEKKLKSQTTFPFLLEYLKKPIGFIQFYLVGKNPPLPDIKKDAVGVDLFIGKMQFIGLCLGSEILNGFMGLIQLKQGKVQIITDPITKNYAAISTFKKSGFVDFGKVSIDGEELLILGRG